MKRLLIAALAPATAASLVLVAPTSAHADAAVIGKITVKPGLAVQTAKSEQKISLEVRATNAASMYASAEPTRGNGGALWFDLKETAKGSGIWRASDALSHYFAAGTWKVQVVATDAEYDQTTKGASFQVRRATYFAGFNAAPSPVRRGKAISVTGQLRGLNSYGMYVPFKGQKVTIYFKKKGTQKWVRYAVVTTAKNGKFAKRFSAKTSGWWIAGYAGNATWYKSFSKNDGVVVR
ncbi:hypothetical protein [Actinomadura rudentiformis]|uniref:Calcium-binding protein n=1 Tax=Actinomadura rudentiformis TaxID=359158 RepID=A0A6H9YVD8_9ACTN|nr:hypothetical protein [Actinomadura rudentiformis]KAB2347749.1 hypothetical protein F8566_17740 [Actinomadura rudentiformis]